MFEFLDFSVFYNNILPGVAYIRPLVEVLLLFGIIYLLLYSLRGTRGSSMLLGLVMVLVVFTALVRAAGLEVLSWLMETIWLVVPTLLIVIFQPELRRAFAHIGSTPFSLRVKKQELIAEVITAVKNMSESRTGALIVFEGNIGLQSFITPAVNLDAKLNSLLIETIFFPKSPLHDGAMIIRNDKIVAAGAILPLSKDESLSRTLGTRHRAGLGVTDENDCVVVIVSEETGSISIAYQGGIQRDLTIIELTRRLHELLLKNQQEGLSSNDSEDKL